jgi:hypothetical protein
MLAANDLTINVLIVISVQSRDTSRVADPEIDRVWLFCKSNSCPGDACFDIAIEGRVLFSEVVILLYKIQG